MAIGKRMSRGLTWKRVILVYAAILVASHGVRRLSSPSGPVRSGQSVSGIALIDAKAEDNRPISIAYRDVAPQGVTDPPVIVLIHGSPLASRSIDGLYPFLGEKYRVIIPDLPGFGGSTYRLDDYKARTHAKYVIGLLGDLGINRAHFFGYSRGGAVVLNVADLEPARVSSIILGSGNGLLEFELFGHYGINRLLFAAQVCVLWLIQEGVPHFGLLDHTLLDLPYARNFHDSDLRPLRRVLKEIKAPLLILHGIEDKLVPYAAALEHHRLVPHSELVTFDGAHMLIFSEPQLMADSMDSFVERVESGTAKIREEADPIRIKTADQPFDYGNIPSAGAFAFLVAVTLIFFVAWISPIAAAVAAGLLVANSVLELPAALMASIFGILTVELLFFFCGRWDVASLLQRWPFRSMVCERLVEVSEKWIQQSGALFLFKTPLYHGSRLSVLFAAGKLRCSFWRFFIVLILSTFSLGSAALLLALLAGTVVLAHFSDRHASNVELLAGVWFLLYFALNILPPQFSFRGRRLLLSEWRRKRRWEFWPIWAIYPPVVLYILFLGLRNRCLTLFTAVNPTMPASGFMGTGKIGILTGLAGAEDSVAQWISVEYDSDREEQMAKVEGFLDDNDLQYPVVFKPVDGQRGLGVTIVQSPDEARRFFDRAVVDTIVQEQISGEEYGIFYYRYPDEEKGRIFSITDKRLLSLRGDGEKTLEELILEDDRAVCMAPFFLFQHRERLFEIPGRGEHIQITELGVHSRGSLFLDGGHLLTPALTDAVDAISKQYEGFFFGRYDMRVPSAEALQEGRDLKVIELNGITSEATHIYDPGNSYFYGCRTLMEQWRIAFEIGARNSACGVEPLSLIALLHHCLEVNARQRRIV